MDNNKLKKIIKNNYGFSFDNCDINNCFYYNFEKINIVTKDIDEKYIKEIFNLSNFLYNNNYYSSTILYNKNEKLYVEFDNKKIILLKINNMSNEINYSDMFKINISYVFEKFDIKKHWSNIIDEYEKKITNYSDNNLKVIANYYIGMGEVAIQLMSNYNTNNDSNLCHLIDFRKYNIENFYNPFNFIKSNIMYDLADYVKHLCFNYNFNYKEVDKIINSIENIDNQTFFFSCLIFPNFAFDEYINDINYKQFQNFKKNYEYVIDMCKLKFYSNSQINKIIY